MKKIFYFASMMLAVFTTYSCTSIEDNPANGNIPVTIEDANGNKYETSPIATFTGEVGSEVTLGLGVYDNYDIYGVDFGDGKIVVDTVGNQNGGVKGEDGKTLPGTTHTGYTKFTGTVAGNGTIIVYGKSDIWYLNLSGGALPTSFDQEKLQNVVQVSITGANVESLELPALEKMTQFTFNNSPLKSIDVSKATALTSLTINNTTASKYEPQLESIDLSKNTELTNLSIQGNTKASGKLTSLDLTNNTKLSGMGLYVQYNQLTEVKLPECGLTAINVQNNNLTSLDLSKLSKLKNIYVSNNKLTVLDFSNLVAGGDINIDGNEFTELALPVSVKNLNASNNKLTKVTLTDCTASCKLENNYLTLATLPTKPEGLNTANKIKKFTYSPQAEMEVAPANGVLDLSAQATAQGIEAEPQATVFAITAGDATLEANKDYTIENGKITFLANFNDVIVKMTNAGFPNLTLATKPFNVTAGEIASPFFSANPIATWDAPASSETEITSTNATVTGGKIYAINQQESAKAMIKNQGGEVAFQCTNNNTFFKIVLDKALQAGDVISIRMQSRNDTDLGLFFAASDSRPNETTTSIILPTAESQAWVAAPTYTVKTDDGICGLTTFYAFRATAKSTYFNSFTITRK